MLTEQKQCGLKALVCSGAVRGPVRGAWGAQPPLSLPSTQKMLKNPEEPPFSPPLCRQPTQGKPCNVPGLVGLQSQSECD